MNPHRLFLLILAVSVPLTSFTFVKNFEELETLLIILAIAGSLILLLLVVTRKYWKNARRISSC